MKKLLPKMTLFIGLFLLSSTTEAQEAFWGVNGGFLLHNMDTEVRYGYKEATYTVGANFGLKRGRLAFLYKFNTVSKMDYAVRDGSYYHPQFHHFGLNFFLLRNVYLGGGFSLLYFTEQKNVLLFKGDRPSRQSKFGAGYFVALGFEFSIFSLFHIGINLQQDFNKIDLKTITPWEVHRIEKVGGFLGEIVVRKYFSL